MVLRSCALLHSHRPWLPWLREGSKHTFGKARPQTSWPPITPRGGLAGEVLRLPLKDPRDVSFSGSPAGSTTATARAVPSEPQGDADARVPLGPSWCPGQGTAATPPGLWARVPSHCPALPCRPADPPCSRSLYLTDTPPENRRSGVFFPSVFSTVTEKILDHKLGEKTKVLHCSSRRSAPCGSVSACTWGPRRAPPHRQAVQTQSQAPLSPWSFLSTCCVFSHGLFMHLFWT